MSYRSARIGSLSAQWGGPIQDVVELLCKSDFRSFFYGLTWRHWGFGLIRLRRVRWSSEP